MESGSHVEHTVLIVDDDELFRLGLGKRMSGDGLRILMAGDTREMDRCIADDNVDVVLLDVRLPGEDGLSACRRLTSGNGPPVILISVLDGEEDRVRGLEQGADRFLTKPCSVREVIAHVRAVLRHREIAQGNDVFWFGSWRIDFRAHELTDRNGRVIELTDGEFAVLRVFVRRPRRVLSRHELLIAARGDHSEAFDRSIDIQISRLRSKLKAPGNSLIRTVRNEGYMFVERPQTTPITWN